MNPLYLFKKNTIYIVGVLFYLTTALVGLMNVGYYYDELLHAVPAQQVIKGNNYKPQFPYALYHTIAGHPIPVMILHYVGPIKTYALIPFFLIFPPTLFTLRIVTVLFGLITLLIIYKLVSKNFDNKAVFIIVLLISSDMSFIFSSKYDWGPIGIQNILKVSLLYLLYDFINLRGSKSKALLIGALSGFMIWDKLNALWFLIPLGGILYYFKLKYKNPIYLKYALSGLITALIPFIIFVYQKPTFYSISRESFIAFETYLKITPSNQNLTNLLSNYKSDPLSKTKTLLATLNGRAIPDHIASNPLSSSGVLSLIAVAAWALILIQKTQLKREAVVTCWLTAGIVAFIYITPHTNGPHHMMMLFPLPHIVIGYCLSECTLRHRKLITVLLTLIVLSNASIAVEFYHKSKANHLKTYWKRTDQELIFTKHQQKYLALDWGISLPIAFASNGEVQIRDLQAFYTPKCQELDDLISIENYTPIRYNSQNKTFPLYYTQCNEVLEKLKKRTTPTFELFE